MPQPNQNASQRPPHGFDLFQGSPHLDSTWLGVTLYSIGDAVIATDNQSLVTFMNPVAESLTGWTVAEAAGLPLESVFRIVNETTRRPAENPVAKALREGIVVGLANHTILIAKDGTERTIDDSAAPIRDGDGQIAGVVLVFRDISRQRALQIEQGRLAALVDSSEDAIIGQTFDAVITDWNAGAEQLFGYSAEEIIGRSMLSTIVPPDRREELRDVLRRVQQGERVEQFETMRQAKSGRAVPVAIRISPIRDAYGKAVGASAIDRDISQQRQAQRRRDARLAVTQTLANETDVEAAVAKILAEVCSALQWDSGCFWRLGDEENVLRCQNFWHTSSWPMDDFREAAMQLAFAHGDSLPGRVWQNRAPVWVPDVRSDPNFIRAPQAENAGLHGGFACPVSSGETFLGVLECFSRQVQPPDEELLEMMASIGEQIGQFIVRREAEQKVQRAERELADFFENASVGLHWVGPDGVILRANPAELQMLGYTRDEYIGRHIADFYVDQTVIADVLERLRRGETVERSPAQLRCKDGSTRDVLVSSNALFENGEFVRSRCFTLDITERKRAQEAEARLAAIVESSEDAIVSKSLDGVIQSWNAGAERIFGYTAEEAVGQPINLIIPPELQDEEKSILERLRRGERIAHFETTRISKTGRRLDVSLTISPVRDSDGRIVGASKVGRDITSRKAAERALRESEQRFRLMADAAPVMIWISGKDKACTWFNEKWLEFVGRPLEQEVGDGWTENVHPDDTDECFQTYTGAFDLREPFSMEYRLRRHDGEYRWVLDTGIPRFGADGELVGFIGSCIDITDRKQAEEALRESEERLRTLADNVSQFAWMADPSGWVFWYNKRWYEYTGTTLEEMQGWGWRKVHHPDHIDRVVENVQHSWDTGQQWEDLFPLRGKDGNYRWFLSRALPIRDSQGRVVRWFGTNTDVTEQREVEEALKEADRRKDEFLAMLAHELRNPLAPIRSGLDILAMEDQCNTHTIGLMQEQVQHLVRLVDDLLDVSRIMRGRIELRKEPMELSALINRSVETIQATIDSPQQELVVVIPEQPIWIDADPIRLIQVFENLLSNAFKYTDDEGRIELTAASDSGQAVIHVRDTGVGIEPELLPNVFELFTQSSRSLDRSQGGLGIGLTLVKRLVEMHGGAVTAHSEGLGRGSEFVVRLPTIEHAESTPQKVKSESANHTRRVLVVDDNVGAARVLAMLLGKLGDHEVEVAHDGPTAVEKIKQLHPQIVLLDIGLPGMDGFEVARAVRQAPELDDVLLAALTGYGQEEDRQKSREAGFDRHIVKPAEISELKELLAESQRSER